MKLTWTQLAATTAALGLAALSSAPAVWAGPQDAKYRVKVVPKVVIADSLCEVDSIEQCVRAQVADRIVAKLADAQDRIIWAQEKYAGQLAEKRALVEAEVASKLSQTLARQSLLEGRLQQGLWRAQEGLSRAFALAEDGDSGWLGVQIGEVTADKTKELKLSAERGVLISEVENDSPAAKAGLKSGDVITEMNGQRIEGTVQFRRLVRETLAGRSVQLTVWRDGRSQQMSVTLGNASERWQRDFKMLAPHDFGFSMNEGPRVFTFSVSRTPRLGISGDDLSGQLGNYFGAPNGEGVLVREVVSGSASEKAGMKAGDVIVKIDGERVRNLSDLRDKLTAKREKKPLPVTVIRKGAETTLNVEIETPKPPERRVTSRRVTL